MNTTEKLLIILILVSALNFVTILTLENKIKNVEKMASEYFAPIPDHDFQGEPQDGRIK
jgi:hypothetical protein